MSQPDQPVESSPAPDPRQGGALARLLRGAGYLARGLRFVREHPRLLPYCVVPLGIAAVVFVVLVCLLILHYGELVSLIWARPESMILRALWYLFYVFIFLLVMLLAYGSFFVVQALLASPFNDLLTERVELLAAGQPPPPFSFERLARTVGRTLLHQAAKLGIYVSIMLPLFLLSLVIPLLGPMLLLLAGSLVTAWFLGYDTLDFSMDRREWSFRRKRAFLREHRALVLGLGGLLEAALLVPVVGLLCLPIAAVGGTLLFCDLSRLEAGAPAPALPEPGAPSQPPDGGPSTGSVV